MSEPDPRPAKRHKADANEWVVLRRLKLGPCRVCGEQLTTLHHLVGKDLGGDDFASNLVPLCGSGTSRCHGLVEHFDRKTCQALRASLTSEEIGYVVGKKSQYHLDRRYPRPDDAEAMSANKGKNQSVGSSSQRSSQSGLH